MARIHPCLLLLLALAPTLRAEPSPHAAQLEREIVVPVNETITLEEYGYLGTLTGDSLAVRIASRGPGNLLSRERFAAIHAALRTSLLADAARNIDVKTSDILILQTDAKPITPVDITIEIEMSATGVSYKLVAKSYSSSNQLGWDQFLVPENP